MSTGDTESVLAEMLSTRKEFCTATVVRTFGSTLAKPGFKIVVDAEGNILAGTLGGACPEGSVAEVCVDAMRQRQPRTLKVFLEDAAKSVASAVRSSADELYVETNCGGQMELFIEPYLSPERVFLFTEGGRDYIAETLILLAKATGFETLVFDPTESVKGADQRYPDVRLDDLKVGDSDYAVVLTRGRMDLDVLTEVSRYPFRFVGLMASKNRLQADVQALRSKGIREDFIKSIHCPLGADIGAQTPAEIAVSIIAELVAERRGKQVARKS